MSDEVEAILQDFASDEDPDVARFFPPAARDVRGGPFLERKFQLTWELEWGSCRSGETVSEIYWMYDRHHGLIISLLGPGSAFRIKIRRTVRAAVRKEK